MRQLKERLITVHMHDLHARGADGHDVPWGTGVGNTEAFLKELHQLGIRPTMFGIEYAYNWLESMPESCQVHRLLQPGQPRARERRVISEMQPHSHLSRLPY